MTKQIKSKKITIQDIAKKVGVSKTTISRYLNKQYYYMSEETRAKISAVIDNSGFVRSNIAVSLAKNKSNLVGVVVADIENPFSAVTINSINEALTESNYNMLIATCNNDFEKEKMVVNSFIEQRVDALLINTIDGTSNYLKNLAKNIPIILLDRNIEQNDCIDIVSSNNTQPIYELIDYLLNEGYTDLYYFTEDCKKIYTRIERKNSFLNKMKELRVKDYQNHVRVVDLNKIDEMTVEVKKIITNSSGIPAIICCNGPTFMCLSIIINRLEIKVPEQLGITGYDDFGSVTKLGWTESASVSLTALTPNWNELGKQAVARAIKRIEDNEIKSEKILVSVPLVVRKSTKLKNKF